MSSVYRAPVADYEFLLRHVVDRGAGTDDTSPDAMTTDDIVEVLTLAGQLATEVLDPLNRVGDTEGVSWDAGAVRSPHGFAKAYRDFAAGGWVGIGVPPELGGGGAPHVVSAAVEEIWASANMAFSLAPGLTGGAISAISASASPELCATYLPPMVEGRWTGTMNLTEPQSGTDLRGIRTLARPNEDGSWSVTGQKIFITWGEHDLTENIVHLVLARTEGAPDGLAGLSLFIVPKHLPAGSSYQPNAVTCVSVERKLGIHASPTCVMQFDAATGFLVGDLGSGLAGMFVMMNSARFGIGVQALGVAERARQHAVAYAAERVQGRVIDRPAGTAISGHPDVSRMLLSMESATDAMRALGLQISAWMDQAAAGDTSPVVPASSLVDFFVPIFKSWNSELAQQIASDALQVHGGMGFIEEAGASQYVRDARILTIYEGTTAIQANDLIGRKVLRDRGAVAEAVLTMIEADLEKLDDGVGVAGALRAEGLVAVALTRRATETLVARGADRASYFGSVPYLMLWGALAGAWMHARIVRAEAEVGSTTRRSVSAYAFSTLHLTAVRSLAQIVEAGDPTAT